MRFMPSDRDRRWLEDIAENIRVIETSLSRTDRAGFGQDIVLRYAVTYALLSISEAARRLSLEIKKRHTTIDWRDVEDAGNAYRHEYHRLDVDILWETATTELAALKQAVSRALKNHKR